MCILHTLCIIQSYSKTGAAANHVLATTEMVGKVMLGGSQQTAAVKANIIQSTSHNRSSLIVQTNEITVLETCK